MNWAFDASAVDPVQDAASPWPQQLQPAAAVIPDYANDPERKKAFAIELGKGIGAFDAGLDVFDGDTAKALWASFNWPNDVEVIAIRDAYMSAQKAVEKPLDKEQLLAKIMAFVDEKDLYGRPVVEAKERLNGLRLYSDIAGFTGKVDINASTTNNQFVQKTVNLVMVKPKPDVEPKVIDQSPNYKSEILNNGASTIKLKLVAGAG